MKFTDYFKDYSSKHINTWRILCSNFDENQLNRITTERELDKYIKKTVTKRISLLENRISMNDFDRTDDSAKVTLVSQIDEVRRDRFN